MTRADYEAEICQRLGQAEQVQFREVSIGGRKPTVANCHDNVDEWVRMYPRDSAVRGWVTDADFGVGVRLTAHSVVRGADGKKFDITPMAKEADRKSLRLGMRFVEHLGSDEEFLALRCESLFMTCPLTSDHADYCVINEEQWAISEDQEVGEQSDDEE